MYNYDGYDRILDNADTGLAVLGGLLIFLIVIAIAVAVFMVIAYWKLFKKAGKNGWEAIVPYYNTWILNEIAGAHWLWFVALIVGSAGMTAEDSGLRAMAGAVVILADIVVGINIAKKFGKSTGFGVLCVLLPFIGYPILAFGSAKYDNSIEVSKNGVFDREFKASKKTTTKANECQDCHEKITKTMKHCPSCGKKLN